MNATKLVAATVTAVSVLGAIGLAYAQSTTPAATPSDPAVQQPNSPSTGSMDATGTSGTRSTVPNATANLPRDGDGMQTERAARNDRN